jgi:hypothetical protein
MALETMASVREARKAAVELAHPVGEAAIA